MLVIFDLVKRHRNCICLSLQVSSSLQITITDVNDNAPMFIPNPVLNPALYIKTIPEEEASLNLVIFDINATDADIGKNGEVEYSIIGGNERGHFAIDPETVNYIPIGSILLDMCNECWD